ncbi:bifunctional adenosylcobinamide kinase/adenosylcobinamide-phosphate guanylyltransferase [Nocardia camponoti]|nr:bifunctional adenosylcobinamide kinase/adenosylcobinamide-phosphate guanylyltransferase [Nocardia camponoti]
MAQRILVLGGARSGKSAFAERLLADCATVRYLATAVLDPTDHDFASRIEGHRDRRPTTWTTVENASAADVLTTSAPATLLDDTGTWLTARIDERDAWDSPRGTVAPDCDALVAAVAAHRDRLVIVSPEVGQGVIPPTRSGRLFRDELGTLNQRLAEVCDEVYFVIAGLPTRLK